MVEPDFCVDKQMAKDFSRAFYNSKMWQDARDRCLREAGGWCEVCAQRGVFSPAVIVHHRITLTPELMKRPDILTAPENLMAVCQKCHNEIHTRKTGRRFEVDELGRIAPR